MTWEPSKVPALNYDEIIAALQRDGWVVVRQEGSLIRLRKLHETVLEVKVPAHKPVKRSTLSLIIKQAGLTLERFLELL